MAANTPSTNGTVSSPQLPHRLCKALSPKRWGAPVSNSECSLHQLAPYIGKLKSCIAADIIETFSEPGDLVADPFCGAGTVALEARLARRRVFASDISPYAEVLTRAKLEAPPIVTTMREIEALLRESECNPPPDLRTVPKWVRAYFHPRTLKEAVSFSRTCQKYDHVLGLSCLLGILHHQRPGFLSYPSSHLVPYLRTRKFPVEHFSSLYEYRALRPRLLAKVMRAYKRFTDAPDEGNAVVRASIEDVTLPAQVDVVITSPPYMNALDYGRDNRLRLWFVSPSAAALIDDATPATLVEFTRMMTLLASKVASCLKIGGYCAIVVGDVVARGELGHPSRTAVEVFTSASHSFRLISSVEDVVPDVRRARPDCRGVKGERIVVFQKVR